MAIRKIFSDNRPTYGQDPHVTMVDGVPLLCESLDEEKIAITVLESLDSLKRVSTTVVWDRSEERQVWAPELHLIHGLWYIYYTASDGQNANHRTYVLQAPHFLGPYWFIGSVGPDVWGIDMTQFLWWDNKRYAIWSGWEKNGSEEFPQNLYIGQMNSPWSVRGRVKLAVPEYDWEKSIQPILEGPQVWINDKGRLGLLYSANASWKTEYSTGAMVFFGSNPLNRDHWRKHPTPVLSNAGHGCVVQDYFIYHRKLSTFPGWWDREIVSMKVEDL